jgi:hypothetical protein
MFVVLHLLSHGASWRTKKFLGKNAYVTTGEAASFAFDIARTTEADPQ